MKNLSLLLIIIVAIEYHLAPMGDFLNAPDWIKAWDENGQEVELWESWELVEDTFRWSAWDLEGNLVGWIQFWESY